MRRIDLIMDLQYGSTGKGLLAGYLAERNNPDTIVTAWAANAGHTYINGNGRRFVHTMLANGIVSKNLRNVLLGPGSIIDPDNLLRECEQCEDLLYGARIFIHANAAVISQRHRDEEAGPMTKIGSTKKGVGAAAIQRIRRDPEDMNIAGVALVNHPVLRYVSVLGPQEYDAILKTASIVQIEGAQGYSLSMYHGFYPYCTSRDVSTYQVLADCGIPHNFGQLNVIGTARTYPIRVANRFDEAGKQVGWSGPNYPDQEEISFEMIGQPVELTTVTKLPRRIFTFSMQQIRDAVHICGVSQIFLNFTNYLVCEDHVADMIKRINRESGATVGWIGTGPTKDDVYPVTWAGGKQ
jgi:adenylosuccinate synthase